MFFKCGVGEDSAEFPWTAKKSNQSILKGISLRCSFEGLMLKLKFQYFGHLMQRSDSFEKTWCWERLKAGGEWNNRRWDGWMASLTQCTWVCVNSGIWWWSGRHPGILQSIRSQRFGYDWVTELNWIIKNWIFFKKLKIGLLYYTVVLLLEVYLRKQRH